VPHSPVHIFSASLILGSLRCVGPILCLRALYTARTLVNVELSAGNINPLARIFGIGALIFAGASTRRSRAITALKNAKLFRCDAKILVKRELTPSAIIFATR
jgi:hypothetical protein